ncbi:MAG: hypothetical protein GKR94_24395 [Gammaproteobacteria bacterium]|nr:hypothetical protein [Gammaproteobacteria bacterium]
MNQGDPSFGEENLSHAAWARFRMAVRADGLNSFLTTDRERFRDTEGLRIFRAFLRRVFSKARTAYDNDRKVTLPDGGDALVKTLGVLSLNPLRSVVLETLKTKPAIPDLFDETGIQDRQESASSWRKVTGEDVRKTLGQVKIDTNFENDDGFVKFRISDSTISVNKKHPFVAEHSRTKAEKELIRTVGMVQLLTDVYSLNAGVPPSTLAEIRRYRDRLMRYQALKARKSAAHVAQLLLTTQHRSENSKLLEAAVSDALTHLGFSVTDLAKPGQPEGIAKAYAAPSNVPPTLTEPHPPLYSFTFDAKSSKHEKAATNNLNLAGIADHRSRFKADHALVVTPGFSDGTIAARCAKQKITPLRASDLARLLEITVEFGVIPVTKLRELLQIYDPNKVAKWVDELGSEISAKRVLSIDVFIKALEALEGKVPDALDASTVSLTCRETVGAKTVQNTDVLNLARGLAAIIPDVLGVQDQKIIVNASPKMVAQAVKAQLEQLHAAGGASSE